MNRIPIVAISDKKLAFSIATLFINLLETKKEDTFYELNAIVTSDFSEENINKIKQIEQEYIGQCSINFVVMDKRFDNAKNGTGYIANAAAFRFVLGEKLPQYDKVLYLDTDILVFDDLSSLYSINIKNNYIGGVFSIGHYLYNDEYKYRERINIPDLYNYVNSGVLLFNLKMIRENNIEVKLQSLVGSFNDSVDQHIFNKVCYGKIQLIPPKYNVTRTNDSIYRSEKCLIAFSNKEREETFNPIIYHYTGRIKPWNSKNLKYSIIWLRYYSMSPFSDIELKLEELELPYFKNKKIKFWQKCFSVQNEYSNKKLHKIIYILGIKIKFKVKNKAQTGMVVERECV